MDRLTAAVYLAEDLKHQRKVAVKVLQPELAAVIGAERFLSEIKTTANLQHPHILPLFDSGSADGLLFYVMPYVDGETLRRLATEVAGALDSFDQRRRAPPLTRSSERITRRHRWHSFMKESKPPFCKDVGCSCVPSNAPRSSGGARQNQNHSGKTHASPE